MYGVLFDAGAGQVRRLHTEEIRANIGDQPESLYRAALLENCKGRGRN